MKNVQTFVARRRVAWERLSADARALERSPGGLDLDALRDFGRASAVLGADLAYARAFFPRSQARRYLERLAGRVRVQLQPLRQGVTRGLFDFYRQGFPALYRRHRSAVGLAAAWFVFAALLGYGAATALGDFSSLFLEASLIDQLHRGEFWAYGFFRLAPPDLATVALFSNNLLVAFAAFALGLSAGLGTLYLLSLNGLVVGVATAECSRYGLSEDFWTFIAAHGPLEMSAIFLAAGAGLSLGRALVAPGRLRRAVAVRLAASEGAAITLGVLPLLALAAVIEAQLSAARELPGALRVALGAASLLGLLAYLERSPVTD